jgi:hypothetical protein
MIKVIDTINIQEILNSYYAIEKSVVWTDYGYSGKQVGLQYRKDEDPWTSAVGRSKGDELSFDILNDFFINSVFEKIINQYNLKRTRLMWLGAKCCYSMHRDYTPRVHIPLVTNPQCLFVFKHGEIEYLESGNVYWVDTRKDHSAMNGSNDWRLHLVGAVES